MSFSAAVRRRNRRALNVFVAGLVIVVAAFAATLGCQSLGASSPTTASPTVLRGEGLATAAPTAVPPRAHQLVPPSPSDVLSRSHQGALGSADGVVPDGTTVFDDQVPAVAKLDPDLLRALRKAARDAVGDGVTFFVNSGWRSQRYQEQLLDEAVSTYGSRQEAGRWVATPTTSAHVSGDAVDLGHSDTTSWLSRHGAAYGLCQIYRNEPWHYELRPGAVAHGCPAMYADPTQDPRMQQ